MNAQERTLLVEFLDRLIAAQAQHKDPEAASLINEACARQPDASYLLVQRALQLEQALKITQEELKRLQEEKSRSPDAGSFLGSPNAWGRSAAATSPTGAPVPPPAQRADSPAAPGAAQAQQRWGSGILGNAAATAAGVVAGSFLFQGVQNLLGRHGTDAPWGTTSTTPAPQDNVALEDVVDETPEDDSFDTSSWDESGDGGDFA
ncbi:MAG: DUF2076 domain-containing protein [Rhodospirillaceae bacterium]